MEEKIVLNTKEAAEYLGLSRSGFAYHLYHGKVEIKRNKLGNELYFTKEQLDKFQAARRSPGRPRKSTLPPPQAPKPGPKV